MTDSNYHAKDLLLKNIVDAFAHDSLQWIGIDHTDVVGTIPTELATVEIRQDMMDYVFTLADGHLLHLEFQSTADTKLHRFLLYDTLLAQKTDRKIRMVVLYENQVANASLSLDIGSAQYHVDSLALGLWLVTTQTPTVDFHHLVNRRAWRTKNCPAAIGCEAVLESFDYQLIWPSKDPEKLSALPPVGVIVPE